MRITLVLALVIATAGCPFDDDDGDGSNYVAIDQVAATYKDAYCTYLARCGLFPDKAACVGAQLSVSYDVHPNIVAAYGLGRVSYNGNNVKACFDALAQRSCDRTAASARVTPRACSDIFRGTLAGGDACTIDQECISQRCLGGSTETTCRMGSCSGNTPPSYEPAALGMPCGSAAGCVEGAYCNFDTIVCTALKTEGTECTSDTECAYGLACTGSTGTRTCMPPPTEGQPCPDSLCRDIGTRCDFSTVTCIKVGLPPAPCTSSSQCSQYYPCNFTSGTCAKGPGRGESCSTGGACFDAGTYCDSATLTCEPLKTDGTACTSASECASFDCDFSLAIPVCRSPMACF